MNKKKIFNDPVYGFISIPYDIIYDLIEHPYFQRLRNIKQLGLTHLVYPGALHTRFHHALGAMHLMGEALESIRYKGTIISEEEAEAVTIAILLHDIGHGPFSHALEHSLINDISHEEISIKLMENLNSEFKGRLDLALSIFLNKYPKKFLHQLVSSQLDMDRMDYLNRDSFYTGVSEGIIGFDRILKMLRVENDNLVIEEKGIYSIEKFLIARRLMYWQVYYHKTVLSAEQMLLKILERAKILGSRGIELFASPCLKTFIYEDMSRKNFFDKPHLIESFVDLDDSDLHSAIKVWRNHSDWCLSTLSTKLINRELYKINIKDKKQGLEENPKEKEKIEAYIKKNCKDPVEEILPSFYFSGHIKNNAYSHENGRIDLIMKDGSLLDIGLASDNLNLTTLSKTVQKQFVCQIKNYN